MDQGYLGSARREAQDPELVVICYVELEEFLFFFFYYIYFTRNLVESESLEEEFKR